MLGTLSKHKEGIEYAFIRCLGFESNRATQVDGKSEAIHRILSLERATQQRRPYQRHY